MISCGFRFTDSSNLFNFSIVEHFARSVKHFGETVAHQNNAVVIRKRELLLFIFDRRGASKRGEQKKPENWIDLIPFYRFGDSVTKSVRKDCFNDRARTARAETFLYILVIHLTPFYEIK